MRITGKGVNSTFEMKIELLSRTRNANYSRREEQFQFKAPPARRSQTSQPTVNQ
jgi:hypothetical protein